MDRAKILSDILGTVSTLNEYYNAAPGLHRSPIQAAYDVDWFGVRPGTKIHRLTAAEEKQTLKDMAEDDAAEALKKEYSAGRSVSLDRWPFFLLVPVLFVIVVSCNVRVLLLQHEG